MRGGQRLHGAARYRIWPNQQVIRELPEGGVGWKEAHEER
jgi:hypothetical protein